MESNVVPRFLFGCCFPINTHTRQYLPLYGDCVIEGKALPILRAKKNQPDLKCILAAARNPVPVPVAAAVFGRHASRSALDGKMPNMVLGEVRWSSFSSATGQIRRQACVSALIDTFIVCVPCDGNTAWSGDQEDELGQKNAGVVGVAPVFCCCGWCCCLTSC